MSMGGKNTKNHRCEDSRRKRERHKLNPERKREVLWNSCSKGGGTVTHELFAFAVTAMGGQRKQPSSQNKRAEGGRKNAIQRPQKRSVSWIEKTSCKKKACKRRIKEQTRLREGRGKSGAFFGEHKGRKRCASIGDVSLR